MNRDDHANAVRQWLDADRVPHQAPRKVRYRWSHGLGVWVLQGLHRLAPAELWPSHLQPAPQLLLLEALLAAMRIRETDDA